MRIYVVSRGSGRTLVDGGLLLAEDATVADLKNAMQKHTPKLYTTRQRFTLPPDASAAKPTVLEAKNLLSEYGLKDGSTVVFKDLGPQIGYNIVFYAEYFGPLVIFPLVYTLREYLYPGLAMTPVHTVQSLATVFWTAHFLKRELETAFVHTFSNATMPIGNLYRNCLYYYSFAFSVAYFICHPNYTPPASMAQVYIGLGLGAVCELMNFICHVQLRLLRKRGPGYHIPRGGAFELITCPNYTFEILAWLGFNIATVSVMGGLFMLAGAYPMTLWAIAKHKRLRRLFDGTGGKEKYPRRYIIFPLVL